MLLMSLFLPTACRHAFATLSFIAEIFIFLYVGMDALDIEKWRFVSDRYVYYIKSTLFPLNICLEGAGLNVNMLYCMVGLC